MLIGLVPQGPSMVTGLELLMHLYVHSQGLVCGPSACPPLCAAPALSGVRAAFSALVRSAEAQKDETEHHES